MLLSIIVPVFNVNDYLQQCIDSIIGCAFKDIEIILVDDGSTDSSGDICDIYAKGHDNIIVIHQRNGGLSHARNTGIRRSQGEYILFLDSDDYLMKEQLKKCYSYLYQIDKEDKFAPDMIVNDFYRCYKSGKIFEEIKQIDGFHDTEYLQKFISSKGCYWNAWRVIYKREYLLNCALWFKEGYLCEDIDFTTRALLLSENIKFLHIPYYCYRLGRTDSIMNVVSYERVFSIVEIITDLIKQLMQNQNQITLTLKHRLVLEYIFSFTAIYEVKKEDRIKTTNLLLNAQFLLQDGTGIVNAVKISLAILGIKPIALLLLIAKRIRRMIRLCKIS